MVGKAVGGMVSEVVDKMVGDKYCDVFGEGVADLDGDTLRSTGNLISKLS